MKKRWIKPEASIELGVGRNQPELGDFPKWCWKNGDYRAIFDHGVPRYIERAIEMSAIYNRHRYGEPERIHLCIDIKVHNLKVGDCPCQPGWHTDGVLDLRHPSRAENNELFVTGENALTEFIISPIDVMYWDDIKIEEVREQIDRQKYLIGTIPSCTWSRYGRNFHRGPIAKADGPRLLIRVTETDLIKPVLKPWKEAPPLC